MHRNENSRSTREYASVTYADGQTNGQGTECAQAGAPTDPADATRPLDKKTLDLWHWTEANGVRKRSEWVSGSRQRQWKAS